MFEIPTEVKVEVEVEVEMVKKSLNIQNAFSN